MSFVNSQRGSRWPFETGAVTRGRNDHSFLIIIITFIHMYEVERLETSSSVGWVFFLGEGVGGVPSTADGRSLL